MNNIQIINPLIGNNYFKLELDGSVNNRLIINTLNIINNNKSSNTKLIELTRLIKKSNNMMVFKILINLMPYSNWIKLFDDCDIMKNYWNEDLITEIQDNSIKRLYINELNTIKTNSYTNTTTNKINYELINLKNNVNIDYNFREEIINKRKIKLNEILNIFFNNIDINDFYGDENVLLLLGYNDFYTKKLYPNNFMITLFGKKNFGLKINDKIKSFDNDDYIIFCHNKISIKIWKNMKTKESIWLETGINGYINFENNDVYVNCLIYQNLENKKNLMKIEQIIGNDSLTKSMKINSKKEKYSNTNIYNTCYECKKYYNDNIQLDGYKSHCLECGTKCYEHFKQKADLNNITTLITGIRVKIGHYTALRILRNGGNVIGTTRYPNLCLNNYANEKDYDTWKNNLKIIKCDFLNLDEVYNFLDIINNYKINIFINMAFRTIKPTEYYNNKVNELEGDLSKKILILDSEKTSSTTIITTNKINTNYLDLNEINVSNIKNDSMNIHFNKFKDVPDVNQVTSETAWDKKINEISRKEIVECVAINELVPVLIINELKDKLVKPKFIINISSLEGQFSTKKTNKHPHTNMAKAKMNMLIKTLENDDDKDLNVHTIDVGYVTGINNKRDDFPVPVEDAASRVTFPIFMLINNKKLDKKFIKMRNYEPCEW
jgi:NAD(P)-dependent dehydrogenase (short-subunit alcohol dehydrogenase family)